MVGSSELKLIVRSPCGAGADRVSVKSCGANPAMVVLGAAKLMLAVTRTGWLSDVYPDAEPVILANPSLIPVNCG